MKSATKLTIALLAMMLWALPAWAQTTHNVTFQVDLSAAIDACQFVVESDSVLVRGSMNDWSDSGQFDSLSDDDGDGVYATTLFLNEGETYQYKFFAGRDEDGALGYEDVSSNRTYTVTTEADQVIPTVNFGDKESFTDLCNAQSANYEFEFRIDMSVASLTDTFNPEAGDFVVVAGGVINGWSTTQDTLQQDFVDPNLYTGIVQVENVIVPSEMAYKFVIGKPGGEAPGGWESVDDRKFALTGNETDENSDGFLDVVVNETPIFYNNVSPDEVITETTTITFEVDLRPAFYYLEDNGMLPVDTQTRGETGATIDGLFIDGPVAGGAQENPAGIADWSQWGGPDGLGSITTRQLLDDGTGGDAAAADMVYTLQYTYSAGTPRNIVGKFGINGFDNEAGEGCNRIITIDSSSDTVQLIFGAMQFADGDVTDDCGPTSTATVKVGDYDPYIVIDNSTDPATVTVVRNGGESDGTNTAIEDIGGQIPTQIDLGANYPNPFAASTAFEYSIDRAQHVTLRVFDMLGREVATLVDGVQAATTYRITFDANDLANGLYLYRLEAGGQSVAKTMLLVK